MSKIPDLADRQVRAVESTLPKRYPESPVGPQRAQTDFALEQQQQTDREARR